MVSARTQGIVPRFVLLLLLLVPSAARSDAPDTSETSDRTATTLLTAMKAQDYAAAFAMFDSKMKQAVSEEKLRAVWSARVGSDGALRSWEFTHRAQEQGRDLRVALLTFERGKLEARIWINPVTQEVGGFLLRPPTSTKPAAPASYVKPSEFRSTELVIGTAPWALGATLTVPIGLDRYPGVVLVHGSGPHDRDETLGPNKVFRDLAEGLSSRGIAVLRYDKRTFVHGSKVGDTLSVDEEVVEDAIVAVAVLRARPEIDPDRITIVGHSLGALLAPEIAGRAGNVASAVLLAPPGRPLEDMVLSQMRYLGVDAKTIADAERQVSQLKAGTLGSERFLGAPPSYWADLAKRDGIATARKLGKPLLLMRGERDYQVLDEDLAAWRKGLEGMRSVEIATLPKLNHLFIEGSGKPGPAEYEHAGHVDVTVIDKIATFVSPRK
jgi:dienelactone hydrolase